MCVKNLNLYDVLTYSNICYMLYAVFLGKPAGYLKAVSFGRGKSVITVFRNETKMIICSNICLTLITFYVAKI